MSPEMQQFESFFKPADPSHPLPFDQARYQEELQDFTNFFERLAAIDSREWFQSEEALGPVKAAARAPLPSVAQPAAQTRKSAETSDDDDLDEAAVDEFFAADAEMAAPPVALASPAAASQPNVTKVPAAAEHPAPPSAHMGTVRPARMQVFHSDLDPNQPGAIPALPEAFPPMRGGVQGRSGFRTFLSRLQWGLVILFGGVLLFAMGLGMGALVLSIPKHGQNPFRASAPEPAVAEAEPAAVAAQAAPNLTVKGTTPAAPVKQAGKAQAKTRKAAPAQAAPSAKPAAPTKAQAMPLAPVEVKAPSPASAAATPANTAGAGNATPAAKSAPVVAPVAAAPATVPVTLAPLAPAEGSVALQVGACGSYACVEQFRNLLLSEVDSKMIRVVATGEGTAAMQRIRIEPLARDEANKLKDKLAAKDARFGKAYVISVH